MFCLPNLPPLINNRPPLLTWSIITIPPFFLYLILQHLSKKRAVTFTKTSPWFTPDLCLQKQCRRLERLSK